MITGGKKEMLSRNVLIFRREVTWTQMAVFSIDWKSRQARLIFFEKSPKKRKLGTKNPDNAYRRARLDEARKIVERAGTSIR
jgi:hypothetical protein